MFKYSFTFYNFFFILMIFMSIMNFLSSSSWLSMWIWLEMNLIMFISFLMYNNNKLINESSLIYFLIQTIASIILLFSILMMLNMKNYIYLLILSLLMKLGSAPFHYWLPLMIESLDWLKIFFLLTFQKINPLYLMSLNNYYLNLKMFIIFSLIIGSIMGLNFLSLKKIIVFSSINQLSWMFLSLNNIKLFKLYLFIYIYLMWIITKSFNFFNFSFLNQLFNLNYKNKFIKLFIFMNLLSLGGLPPFIGFFPKLLIIMNMNNLMMMFLMILFSLLTLFMYLRIIMSLLMINSMKINKIYKMNNSKNFLNMMKFMLINNKLLIILLFMN